MQFDNDEYKYYKGISQQEDENTNEESDNLIDQMQNSYNTDLNGYSTAHANAFLKTPEGQKWLQSQRNNGYYN